MMVFNIAFKSNQVKFKPHQRLALSMGSHAVNNGVINAETLKCLNQLYKQNRNTIFVIYSFEYLLYTRNESDSRFFFYSLLIPDATPHIPGPQNACRD